MKKVLLTLALIIATSSIAYADGLDGKAVWCPDFNIGLVFSEGKVKSFEIRGYSTGYYGPFVYRLDSTDVVKWDQGLMPNSLSRSSLWSSSYGQCSVSSEQMIIQRLKTIINQSKKKNKI